MDRSTAGRWIGALAMVLVVCFPLILAGFFSLPPAWEPLKGGPFRELIAVLHVAYWSWGWLLWAAKWMAALLVWWGLVQVMELDRRSRPREGLPGSG